MMVKVKEDCYINANEVAIIKLNSPREIEIFLINQGIITITAATEDGLEKEFNRLAYAIDSLQRQTVK